MSKVKVELDEEDWHDLLALLGAVWYVSSNSEGEEGIAEADELVEMIRPQLPFEPLSAIEKLSRTHITSIARGALDGFRKTENGRIEEK